MRTCHRCGVEKPVEAFYANTKDKAHGRAWECIECTKARSAVAPRTEADRAASRRFAAKTRLAKHGLTLEDYQRMYDEQCGVCLCCSQPETAQQNGRTKYLAVDHDHVTGKVRGLLCARCNIALGLVGDDVDVLMALATFLLRQENLLDLSR